MALPNLTAEQRADALKKAAYARSERAAFLESCKVGNIPVERAIEAPVARRVPVLAFIKAFPGIGNSRAKAIMEACGIAESRRVAGLGCRQKVALIAKIKASYQAKQQ